MSIDYATLKGALQGDQALLDLLGKGSDAKLAEALNVVSDKIDIARTTITREQALNAIVSDDYIKLTPEWREYLGLVFSESTIAIASLVAAFAGTATGDALLAMSTRKGTKAEQLFGANILIRDTDIIAARKA